MTPIGRIGIAGLALVFGLAACSKGSQSSSTTSTTTETSAAPAAPDNGAASPMAAAGGANASDGAQVYQTN